jgi:hypothetical protein
VNHHIILNLRIEKQASECLLLELSVQNDSRAKLLLPAPDLPNFEFHRAADGKLMEWYTDRLVNADWRGIILEPGAEELATHAARTSPRSGEDYEDGVRWHIPLEAGRYKVRVRCKIDEDYFDPDSHWRLTDLEREAVSKSAEVWLGDAFSNELEIAFDPAIR